MNTEIQARFEELALKKSIPFCYQCYRKAPSGRCETCGSDNLMRELPGAGCEYGIDWIIREIVKAELTPVDTAEAFDESARECYPETVQALWMTLDAVSVAKEMDPVSWNMARSEWESQEADEGNLITFDGGATYYRRDDLASLG